ncbi:hypothetical protein [Nakamurella antarctica]|uniref:hypothetical protein n=1 Tax=Nakamurella antarctica TaxID=1902245 RepID=UPI0013DE2065|nr:hypothetical protein [Nakamurella antarctica]
MSESDCVREPADFASFYRVVNGMRLPGASATTQTDLVRRESWPDAINVIRRIFD